MAPDIGDGMGDVMGDDMLTPGSASASSSSSSYSLAPINYVRQCVRLMEPDDSTTEQRSASGLTITVNIPYLTLRAYFAMLPNSGPDILAMNSYDQLGQPVQLVINCWLWMSDCGYVLISTDQSTQFLISGISGPFFDANAQAINTRNVGSMQPPLLACANADRYDYDTLLVNQVRPTLFIYDGITINGSSSSPGQ